MDPIPIDECQDGWLYRIKARNAPFGIWRAETNGFVISRTKFASNYLFEEYHWETGPPFGTVNPYQRLEQVPEELWQNYLTRIREDATVTDKALLDYLNQANETYKRLVQSPPWLQSE